MRLINMKSKQSFLFEHEKKKRAETKVPKTKVPKYKVKYDKVRKREMVNKSTQTAATETEQELAGYTLGEMPASIVSPTTYTPLLVYPDLLASTPNTSVLGIDGPMLSPAMSHASIGPPMIEQASIEPPMIAGPSGYGSMTPSMLPIPSRTPQPLSPLKIEWPSVVSPTLVAAPKSPSLPSPQNSGSMPSPESVPSAPSIPSPIKPSGVTMPYPDFMPTVVHDERGNPKVTFNPTVVTNTFTPTPIKPSIGPINPQWALPKSIFQNWQQTIS